MRHPTRNLCRTLWPAWRSVAALLVILAGLALSACQEQAPEAEPAPAATLPAASVPEAPGGEPVQAADPEDAATAETATGVAQPTLSGEIVLWHSWAGAEGDALAQILQSFAARYPGVRIDTLFVAHDDLLQSYAEAVAGGAGPTLLLAPNWWLEEMVLLQLVAPFGPELAQSTVDSLLPAALDSMRRQDALYGVPVHVTAPALYVNTDLYPLELPTSLDAWLDQARATPEHGIGLYANLYHLAWGLGAFDGRLFDDRGTVVLDQTGGATDFLMWLIAVNETPGSYVDQDYGMLLDRFKKEEFAFLVDGPWSLGELEPALAGRLTVQPLPPGPAGPAQTWLYADGLFLNPNTPEAVRRVSVTFAEHISGPDAAQILAGTGRLLPANRLVELDPQSPLRGFHEQAAQSVAMPAQREMDAVWGYGGDMILRALLGYRDLQGEERRAAIDALVAETTTLINEANGR